MFTRARSRVNRQFSIVTSSFTMSPTSAHIDFAGASTLSPMTYSVE
jgi:hypothetical protein